MQELKDKFLGCLYGGAIGDALGYPIEFLKLNEIYENYGTDGIKDLKVSLRGGKALISDDTQMTLFTAEGIINGHNSKNNNYIESTFYSYQRWLYTQGFSLSKEYNSLLEAEDSLLLKYKSLFSQRAPGTSCLNALMYTKDNKYGTIDTPVNRSKGCGGVMRVAPAGLYYLHSNIDAFKLGCDLAAITHGHKIGFLAAGAFSSIISDICNGKLIEEAVKNALELLKGRDEKGILIELIEKAINLAKDGEPGPDKIAQIGEGWIAEEAIAISIYCALVYSDNFEEAVKLAVNHSGDSDSTGAICGNMVGARLGIESIPKAWIEKLELAEAIEEMAEKLYLMKNE